MRRIRTLPMARVPAPARRLLVFLSGRGPRGEGSCLHSRAGSCAPPGCPFVGTVCGDKSRAVLDRAGPTQQGGRATRTAAGIVHSRLELARLPGCDLGFSRLTFGSTAITLAGIKLANRIIN